VFQVKKEGSKQNILVSDFRKMFARQKSKVQFHRRRLQSRVRKTCKLVHNVKSVTTPTFESKFAKKAEKIGNVMMRSVANKHRKQDP